MLSAVAVIMWGTGDAAAALIGIPFGKHRGIPHTDGKKSLEGTAAMFLVSALCGTLMLMHHTSFAPELLTLDLDKIWLMFVNETEAAGFAGARERPAFIAETQKKHPSLRCVITLGAAGSLYFDKDRVLRQAAFPAEVLDTTCAGDTFTGYFTAALLNTGDPAAALRRAAAASSVVISRIGAAGMIPTPDEVDDKLRFEASLQISE